MNFSKLTLASFLAQAVLFNFAGTNKALCTATVVVEKQEEETYQDSDFYDKESNLRGNKKVRSNNRFLSSGDDDENRFLVKFKGHSQFMAADMKLQSDPHQIMSLPDDDVEVMTFASEEELQYWEERDDVEYIEPDHKVYRLAENIPYGIKSVKALSVSDGSVSNQKVCIIDTGYDINHPDLQSSTSIVTGHSQVGSSWTQDGHGHGTHVAGTIAALGGNNQGVAGVNRNGQLKLHIVKVFNDSGGWTRTSDLIRAVENCAAAGATVVNMSLGGASFSQATRDAFQKVYNNGILLVAAAGNDSSDRYSYPASYSSVMSVAAVDINNERAHFSQFNDQVDIAAPGVDVLSTIPGGRYARFNGTSMASPHVAGVAALVWSHFPSKTAQEIRQALESTAQDLGSPGRDDSFGHGLVRADLAYNVLKGSGGGSCVDSPVDWYDSDGPFYDCKYYARDNNCQSFGHGFANFGKTANQACCACGGGTRDQTMNPTESPTTSPTGSPSMSPTWSPSTLPTATETISPSTSPSMGGGGSDTICLYQSKLIN